ncbi:hypothetical protein AVEN_157994-1 [Araneus ventricosus]|uniref:Uncharacterized protein n=1 Tax=Araneus ventricosus TaxID=182803 RepID=A0A4Y2MMJ7_ARAVE|nr:hypothetical protein AVEN_157994-1 [Araneus ventricosus]
MGLPAAAESCEDSCHAVSVLRRLAHCDRCTAHEELELPDANAPCSPGLFVHYGKYTLVSRAVRERLAAKLGLVLVILTSLLKQHEGYFGTDLVILNRGQTTRMTPELASLF